MTSSPPVPRIAAPRSVCFGIDGDFDEALSFALLDSSAHSLHRLFGGVPFARTCESPPPSCRIDPAADRYRGRTSGFDRTPGADPVQEIVGNDLVVVVRGMREGALAIAVAERPDARHAGAKLVVDHDVAAPSVVTPALSRPRSSVLGRRPTASSTCVPSTCGAPSVHSMATHSPAVLGQ